MDFVDARSESVGKLWAAGMLSITYPHGSARIGPQDASIKSTGYSDNLAYKNTSCLSACRLLEANKYAPVFSLSGSRNVPMRTSHPSGSRLLKLIHWKSASAPGSSSPRKLSVPSLVQLYFTTSLMVLRRNGPDPEWLKA